MKNDCFLMLICQSAVHWIACSRKAYREKLCENAGAGERRVSVFLPGSLPAVFRSFAVALLGRFFRSSTLTESLAQTMRWSALRTIHLI